MTLGGLGVSLNGATLTTTDQRNWTLGNLSTITAPVGDYQLTLVTTASGITDFTGAAPDGRRRHRLADEAPLAGDFNSDGRVDTLDYGILKAHLGMASGATFALGDANRDGAVNVRGLQPVEGNLWAGLPRKRVGEAGRACAAPQSARSGPNDERASSTHAAVHAREFRRRRGGRQRGSSNIDGFCIARHEQARRNGGLMPLEYPAANLHASSGS